MLFHSQVKFFERKKVTRNISKIEKKIAAAKANGESLDELEKQKIAAEEDLAVSVIHWFSVYLCNRYLTCFIRMICIYSAVYHVLPESVQIH
jgi:hypothetical protein